MVLWRGYVGINDPDSELTAGLLVRCLFYVFLFLGPLAELGNLYERLAQGLAAAQRIFLLLDTKPALAEPAEPQRLEQAHGAIRVEQVHFSYNDDEPVLRDVNLTIPAGQTVAIVGPTGHGKSTFVQLLCRFYDVQQGAIYLDDVNVRDFAQNDLRQHIGIVLQDNILFSGTVLANHKGSVTLSRTRSIAERYRAGLPRIRCR